MTQQPISCEKLLQAMVAYDTVNSSISGTPDAERPLALYIEAQAENLGLETHRLPVGGAGFNLLVTRRISDRAPWLLFESHLDTVSTEGMSIDPFAGDIRDGKLYGRGACDTKGSGAAMLWALKDYAAQPSAAANNIAIVYTVDEEVAVTGARTFVKDHLPALDWQPAGVIVGEPTQLKPVVAHNGLVRWTIKTQGQAAHSYDPSKGRSAITMMTKVIEALESQYISCLSPAHPLTGRAQCSINMIRGGVQINIIPEHCQIHLDRRLVPGESPAQVLPEVERILEVLRQTHPEVHVVQEQPTMTVAPLDPSGGEQFAGFVQRVLAQMGLAAEPAGVGYGTEASSFAPAALPAVVLGPGDIAHMLIIEAPRSKLRGSSAYRQCFAAPVRNSV